MPLKENDREPYAIILFLHILFFFDAGLQSVFYPVIFQFLL